MTGEELLAAMGGIREEFIREAVPPAASYRRRREFPWTGAAAAGLALLLVSSVFFLPRMGGGSDSTAGESSSAWTENETAGESIEDADGADPGEEAGAGMAALQPIVVDGTVYVPSICAERYPETCPEGFSPAGEVELEDTGELCPYYADPDRPGQIYVYQICYEEGTGAAYKGYVRYDAELPD